LRTVYAHTNYLVGTRGISSDRIKVIEVQARPGFKIELWLAAKGSPSPVSPEPENLAASQLLHFDTLWFGPGCEERFTFLLQDPKIAAQFFGAAMRETPTAKGFLFLHPAPSTANAEKLLASLKEEIIGKEKVPAERLVVALSSPRSCAEIDSWLVPSGMVVTDNKDPDVFLRSVVMTEAEKNQFTTRRVEFVGNEHIQDRTLRVRIPELQEGDLFTKDAVMRSLASLNRFRGIRPVSIKDVGVRLNRSDRTIDLVLYFTERSRRTK
jgi:hypothetical protein